METTFQAIALDVGGGSASSRLELQHSGDARDEVANIYSEKTIETLTQTDWQVTSHATRPIEIS